MPDYNYIYNQNYTKYHTNKHPNVTSKSRGSMGRNCITNLYAQTTPKFPYVKPNLPKPNLNASWLTVGVKRISGPSFPSGVHAHQPLPKLGKLSHSTAHGYLWLGCSNDLVCILNHIISGVDPEVWVTR